jgi:uncharacterized protein (DUF2141 family)
MRFSMPKQALFLVATAAVLCAAAITASPAAMAQTCAAVEVHNVRPQQGKLMLAAYGNGESFNKKPMAQIVVPAGDAVTKLEFCGLSGAEVAIVMFQDIDNDGKMGKNMVGMPTEPWGSSGKPGTFGPTWETGKVALDGKPIVVKLSQ